MKALTSTKLRTKLGTMLRRPYARYGLALLLCGACATEEAARETGQPAMRALGEKATVEQGASDESIGREIRRRFELADPAGLGSVIIEVTDGSVTLRGVAPSLKSAWRAEAAAQSTPGTKQVINSILVHQQAGR